VRCLEGLSWGGGCPSRSRQKWSGKKRMYTSGWWISSWLLDSSVHTIFQSVYFPNVAIGSAVSVIQHNIMRAQRKNRQTNPEGGTHTESCQSWLMLEDGSSPGLTAHTPAGTSTPSNPDHFTARTIYILVRLCCIVCSWLAYWDSKNLVCYTVAVNMGLRRQTSSGAQNAAVSSCAFNASAWFILYITFCVQLSWE